MRKIPLHPYVVGDQIVVVEPWHPENLTHGIREGERYICLNIDEQGFTAINNGTCVEDGEFVDGFQYARFNKVIKEGLRGEDMIDTQKLAELLAKATKPSPKPAPLQTSRMAEAMAGVSDDRARKEWQLSTDNARREIVDALPDLLARIAELETRLSDAQGVLQPEASE